MAGRFRQRLDDTFGAIGWSGLASALAAIAVGAAAHWALDQKRSGIEERHALVRSEIAKVDLEIAEIRTLKDQIAAVLGRGQVIDALGPGRNWPVRLLDQLPRLRPEGVELVSVAQRGAVLDIAGNAASHEAVIGILRNLAASQDFRDARLAEVKTDTETKSGLPVRFVAVVGVRPQWSAEKAGK